jgi:hypothetical protein
MLLRDKPVVPSRFMPAKPPEHSGRFPRLYTARERSRTAGAALSHAQKLDLPTKDDIAKDL